MKETDLTYNQRVGYPEVLAPGSFQNETKPWEKGQTDTLVATELPLQLIIWNDHYNTFEWVITALVEVCGHTEEQAEQCAFIIHTKGKYAVKKGDYDTLKPMKDSISERGIGATIEAVV
ncbi:ATP-dependent Clp protease adaptor protein ClpS [Arachidicoccus rhizosphaerae]|uniref:ATP-dependent Clp protease adaptor protein ClpS n=1 Tax=Arachidicoccus rhizosphaerae TaxID=551991 RepID=A0A1H3WPM9_9BACT|nr:ATP-dependent Clp protease adaptor ClpS [Arachidicoccus rhizosphaerae]SDZ88148.1 ATP-dependent Clp protease adaptor protein ClpS [Arachidicoccus rhizosphaerae]